MAMLLQLIFFFHIKFCLRYHHTGPVSCYYALREGLALIASEVGEYCSYYTIRVFITYLCMQSRL